MWTWHQLRPSLVKFLGWFRRPSNVLSVAAILAAVIVPWIEKMVKADEERSAKTDTLLAVTNRLVEMNRQYTQSDVLGNGILAATRYNELARANAIAKSIVHDAYPPVLFALSTELCISGQFDEAHGYLEEVLHRGSGVHFLSERPSRDELAEAHVVGARCYVGQAQASTEARAQYKKLAQAEMALAVADSGDDSDRALGQRAIRYAEWAQMDEAIEDPASGRAHRQKAQEIAKKMHVKNPQVAAFVDPAAPPKVLPLPELKADNIPRSADADTYIVSFLDAPYETGALMVTPIAPRAQTGGTLFFFRSGLFTEAYEVNTLMSKADRITGMDFHRTLPTPAMSKDVDKIDVTWSIDTVGTGKITGVQCKVGETPKRFIASLAVPHEPDTSVTTSK